MYTEQLSEKEKKRLRIVGILRGCIPFIGVILCIIGVFIATKTPSPTALYIRKYLLIGAIASKPFWFGIVWIFTKL